MNTVAKIEARREVVAGTYGSLMKWAKSVDLVPADTSEEIGDYLNLPQPVFAELSAYGFPAVVAEYRGLTTAIEIVTDQGSDA